MLRDKIRKDIVEAVKGQGLELGRLDIEIARTNDPRFGDFTTNAALKISHDAKQSPIEFAKLLSHRLQKQPYIKKLVIANSGSKRSWHSG